MVEFARGEPGMTAPAKWCTVAKEQAAANNQHVSQPHEFGSRGMCRQLPSQCDWSLHRAIGFTGEVDASATHGRVDGAGAGWIPANAPRYVSVCPQLSLFALNCLCLP